MIADDDGPGGKPLNLSQSGAIVLYAAEKSGKLLPRDAVGRAIALQWLMQAANDISGASNAVFHTEMRAPEKSAAKSPLFQAAPGGLLCRLRPAAPGPRFFWPASRRWPISCSIPTLPCAKHC